jgi:hypothetical protein
MNTKSIRLEPRACALAVSLALAALGAQQALAADDEAAVRELTTPTNSVSIGAISRSQDSFKAGEYDGLTGKGWVLSPGLDLRGGAAWDSSDATRWSLRGANLGLPNMEMKAEYGRQGSWRIGASYDETPRYRADTYQTPYLGVGTTNLTLPSNWTAPLYTTGASMGGSAAAQTYPNPSASMLGLAATSYTDPLVAQTAFLCRNGNNGCAANAALGGLYTTGLPVTAANTAMLANNASDLASFQKVELSTKRKRQEYTARWDFGGAWQVNLGLKREDKIGLKTLGVVNSGNGTTVGGMSFAVENAVIVPQLIDNTTDLYNANVRWNKGTSFVDASYSLSMFRNHAKSITVANPDATGTYNGSTPVAYGTSSATLTLEPDNVWQQLRLAGGMDLPAHSRLVADVALSRTRQNDPFILAPDEFATPTGAANAAPGNASFAGGQSANATLVGKDVRLKLTSRPIANLDLAASWKYTDRDNRSPVQTSVWYDAGAKNFTTTALSVLNGATVPGVAAGTPLYSGVNITASRPYSRKFRDTELDADYRLARGHDLHAALDWQDTDRGCSGSWIDCVNADHERENTQKIEYRFRAVDAFHGRLAYDHGHRTVDYNPNAWMSLQPALAATNIASLVAANGGVDPGSVIAFLQANGLTPNGLNLPAWGTSPFTGNTLAIYKLLYGTGNGSLSSNYYGNRNTTQNWAGLGYMYNMATRDRSRLRGSFDWSASDSLTIQGGADTHQDKYPDSIYGLQKVSAWSMNLGADYAAEEGLHLGVGFEHEDQTMTAANNSTSNGTVNTSAAYGTNYSQVTATGVTTGTGINGNLTVAGLCPGDVATGLTPPAGLSAPTQVQIYNNNVKIDPCTTWQSKMRDRSDTVTLSFLRAHAFTDALTLHGEALYSRVRTANEMSGGFYYGNTVAAFAANVPATIFINAASMPEVVNTSIRLRLAGDVRVTKSSEVRIDYAFLRLKVTDYQYALNLPANTSGTVMPDFEAAPAYRVHQIGLSYRYTFQP